ncbi:MAG: SusD/RagB family nutrient-binding outer membrane lipoprotein [Bacteroidetes bacterium]|nr:SusD/RagB family nutrient-binding outer membrane lipoprotein [Bacteroidota bacterium]
MKKIILILTVLFIVTSCSKNLEDMNVNIKDPSEISGESLFTSGQKNLVDLMVSTNVNQNVFRLFAQHWTECTYPDESQYDIVSRNIPLSHWDVIYRNSLKNFLEAKDIIDLTETATTAQQTVKANKLAILEVISVYAYSVLVETFGDIPYTEALNIDIITPVYDDGETVYRALFTRLDAAISALDASEGSFGSADNMYYGDVSKWLKFANSLKFRMAMLMADLDDSFSYTNAVAAVTAGIFESNADNAALHYNSSAPNTNPVYMSLVASGRHDFVPANTLVDAMNALDDPRRPMYFTLFEGEYLGGTYGTDNAYDNFSHMSDQIHEPTLEGVILDYAEVKFLLAEALERGYSVGGIAADHYNSGITASIEYWGGTTTDATTYLAKADVAYATATGPWKQRIAIQKWIALFNRGYTAWREWRRFDYPVLVAPPDAVTQANGMVPTRYTYPVEEQLLNGANYKSASSAIGGDYMHTRLFWDIN